MQIGFFLNKMQYKLKKSPTCIKLRLKIINHITMESHEITEKIQELEKWLIENPNSLERNLIESDIKKLRTLSQKNHE